MTHAELYEIVKDHRDVWGSILEFVPNTVGGGSFLEHDGKHFVDLSPGRFMAEFTLLGLGVAWLVRTDGQFNTYGPVSPGDTFDVPSTTGAWGEGTSILAAVYAAIAEVRAKA